MIADDFSYHFQRSEEISFLSTLERKVENRYKPIWKLLHKSLFPLEFLDKPRKRLKFNLVQRKKKNHNIKSKGKEITMLWKLFKSLYHLLTEHSRLYSIICYWLCRQGKYNKMFSEEAACSRVRLSLITNIVLGPNVKSFVFLFTVIELVLRHMKKGKKRLWKQTNTDFCLNKI